MRSDEQELFDEDPFGDVGAGHEPTPEEQAERKRQAEERQQAEDRRERERAALEARAVPLRIARLANPDRVKLFSVTCTMDGVSYGKQLYDGVPVWWGWLLDREHPPVPLEEAFLCVGVTPEAIDGYAIAALCELLTEENVADLREYLAERAASGENEFLLSPGEELRVEEVELPWVYTEEYDVLPIDFGGTGGGTNQVIVSHKDGRPAFYAYYNVRDTGDRRPKPTLQRAVFSCPLCGEEFPRLMNSPEHHRDRHATAQEHGTSGLLLEVAAPEGAHLLAPFRLSFELAMPDGTARTIDFRTEDPEEQALLQDLDEAELERAMGAAVGVTEVRQ